MAGGSTCCAAPVFEVLRLVELQAPEGARRHEYYDDWDPEWSRRWPSEEIWVARKPR